MSLRSSWQLSKPAGQAARQHCCRLTPAAELNGRAGSSGGSSGEGAEHTRRSRAGGRRKKARQPGLFEVEDISPPRRSLGIHALPPNTHNGDQIEVEGAAYVVQSVVMQYKLVRGKYRRDHARLEVQGTGRWMANIFLENLYQLPAQPGVAGDGGSSGGTTGGD